MAIDRDEIVKGIEHISRILKGPGVPWVERLMLHEDRKDLRKQLADLDAAEPPKEP